MTLETLPEQDAEAPAARPHRRLDRRTIVLCAAVALVAALASAVIVAALASRGDRPVAGLAAAEYVPDAVPLTRFDGSKVDLADYAGQKLVVNFFASTCVPCRKEMPALEQVQRALGEKVTFIGIAVEDDPKAAQALVAKTGVTYDTMQDPTGEMINKSGGTLLPYTIFVAADGTIMERHNGALDASQLRQKISDDLLAGG